MTFSSSTVVLIEGLADLRVRHQPGHAALVAMLAQPPESGNGVRKDADIQSPSPSLSVLRQVGRRKCRGFEAIHI